MSGERDLYDPATGLRLDAAGRPIRGMLTVLERLAQDIAALHRHLDNTGVPCRVDLRGHDCCYTCNAIEDAAAAYAAFMEEP